MKTEPKTADAETLDAYKLKISRLTIDKLGVKLYDKVSAVIAELVANSFDADAETVIVSLPLSTALCTKKADGTPDEKGYEIVIHDDGHGMTPQEAQKFYLFVGKDRRKDPERKGKGNVSRKKDRPVMGRKGIGKLAPFGVCKRIEVLSAGGDEVPGKGFLTSHFYLNYDDIVSDSDEEIFLEVGPQNNTHVPNSGTTIRLTNFAVKTVPDRETFHRQLATRFIFAKPDFNVFVHDTITGEDIQIKSSEVDCVPGTKIDVSKIPVITEEGETLPVKGWLGMAKESYKNQELAGVRIYAREKIVGQTRDFEQPAGFTGEFTVRSYLVGEIEADWLDLDEGDDLIRSDRQGILWESDYGRALRKWGSELIKQIGSISKEPRRKKNRDVFMERSDFVNRAKSKFTNESIVKVAVELAEQIGAFAAGDELKDDDYINDLCEVILTVAPHKALIDAFQEFNKIADAADYTVEHIVDLFDKTKVAEMASYARIAAERVEAIKKLELLVKSRPDENEFQKLLADAPWLIEPTWSVISKNQALKTFKDMFEHWWKEKYGEDVVLAIGYETKRPDFTLINVGEMLHIVEIKKAKHNFDDADCKRLLNYVMAFRRFFKENQELVGRFPKSWRIDLIADGVDLKEINNQLSYENIEKSGELKRFSWIDFLANARTSHEEFLNVSDEIAAKKS